MGASLERVAWARRAFWAARISWNSRISLGGGVGTSACINGTQSAAFSYLVNSDPGNFDMYAVWNEPVPRP